MTGTAQQYPTHPTDPASLFPPDGDARYAGTELETRSERDARTARAGRIPPVTPEHFSRVLAFQSEQFARYADATAQAVARTEVTKVIAERQAVEDKRATRRNRNRFLALVVALLLGFCAPTLCAFLGIPLQYSFCVVVLLDSFVTLYALIRHY